MTRKQVLALHPHHKKRREGKTWLHGMERRELKFIKA
jgi:hypothetical protein